MGFITLSRGNGFLFQILGVQLGALTEPMNSKNKTSNNPFSLWVHVNAQASIVVDDSSHENPANPNLIQPCTPSF